MFMILRPGTGSKRFRAQFISDNNVVMTKQFGSAKGFTFVDHHDKQKRENYLKRHGASNENWDDLTSAALSRWILWGNSTSLSTNIKQFEKKFGLRKTQFEI